MTNIIIEKKDKSGLSIPTVLNIYVTEYHSIFGQRSFEALMMEAGKIHNISISIQHESGLLFAEGYENLDLDIMESHPKIVKAEITDNFKTIKILAYKPGESNIIIYCRNSRRILDVFKVIVESSLTLASEMNLLLGSQLVLFKNAPKKQSFIENLNAKWQTSDSSVIKITNNKNIEAIKEGSCILRLESLDGKTVYLSSVINVSSLNRFKIELLNVPPYITDNVDHKNYKASYFFPFNYLHMDQKYTLNEDYDLKNHEINFNLKTTCSLSNTSKGTFADITTSEDGKGCFLKLNNTKPNNESSITIVISSISKNKSGIFSKENNYELIFHQGFITKTKSIKFSKGFRSHTLTISKPHYNNDIDISTNTPQLVRILKSDKDYIISLFDSVEDAFESQLFVEDKTTSMNEIISISFVKEDQGSLFNLLIIILLFLILAACIALWYIGGMDDDNKVNNKPQNNYRFSDLNKNKGPSLFDSKRNFN